MKQSMKSVYLVLIVSLLLIVSLSHVIFAEDVFSTRVIFGDSRTESKSDLVAIFQPLPNSSLDGVITFEKSTIVKFELDLGLGFTKGYKGEFHLIKCHFRINGVRYETLSHGFERDHDSNGDLARAALNASLRIGIEGLILKAGEDYIYLLCSNMYNADIESDDYEAYYHGSASIILSKDQPPLTSSTVVYEKPTGDKATTRTSRLVVTLEKIDGKYNDGLFINESVVKDMIISINMALGELTTIRLSHYLTLSVGDKIDDVGKTKTTVVEILVQSSILESDIRVNFEAFLLENVFQQKADEIRQIISGDHVLAKGYTLKAISTEEYLYMDSCKEQDEEECKKDAVNDRDTCFPCYHGTCNEHADCIFACIEGSDGVKRCTNTYSNSSSTLSLLFAFVLAVVTTFTFIC